MTRVLTLLLFVMGCGGAEATRCRSTAQCEPNVCLPSGQCGRSEGVLPFSRAMELHVTDWSIDDARSSVAKIGGASSKALHLKLGPLPESAQSVISAHLVLTTPTSWGGLFEDGAIEVVRTTTLDSNVIAESPPAVLPEPVIERALPAGVPRSIRVDVTDLVLRAIGSGATDVSIRVELEQSDVGVLRVHSPMAGELRSRPRIELSVQ